MPKQTQIIVSAIAGLAIGAACWFGGYQSGRSAARAEMEKTAQEAVAHLRQTDPLAARALEAGAQQARSSEDRIDKLARQRTDYRMELQQQGKSAAEVDRLTAEWDKAHVGS